MQYTCCVEHALGLTNWAKQHGIALLATNDKSPPHSSESRHHHHSPDATWRQKHLRFGGRVVRELMKAMETEEHDRAPQGYECRWASARYDGASVKLSQIIHKRLLEHYTCRWCCIVLTKDPPFFYC